MRILLLSFLLCLSTGNLFAQTTDNDDPDTEEVKKTREKKEKEPREKKPVKHFPFVVDENNTEYDISFDVTDPAIISKYSPAFKKHNLPFDAETVEDVIRQIVAAKNPTMAQVITTGVEDKKVMIGSGNKSYQQQVISTLKGVLNNAAELEGFVQKAKGSD